MRAFALISGRLQGERVTGPTKTGGQVTFFTLRVADGAALQFQNVATFSDAVRDELAGLAEGAALSSFGPFHTETYEWNGETRVRLKLTADAVHVLKPRPRAPKPGCDKLNGGAARSGRAESSWAHLGGGSLDDPF
jgi:hypothetical protein